MNWIKKKRFFLKLMMVIISFFFGIVLIEIGLKLINHNDPWSKTKEANILKNFQFSYDISNLYQSHTSNVDYLRNEYGLRDKCREPSEINILTIGGSTTDQRYVAYESTYQAVLEKILINKIDGFGCVSNAGVDGHSTLGHIFSFQHWFKLIPNLKPKFIILYIGINDANFLDISAPYSFSNINKQKKIKDFLKSFEVVRELLPIYNFIRQSSEKDTLAYSRHEKRPYNTGDYTLEVMNRKTQALSYNNSQAFKSRLKTILDEIKDLGSTAICVTQPHRYILKKDGEILSVQNVIGENFSGIDFDYSIRQLNKVIFELCGDDNTLDLYNHKFLSSHFYDGVHTTDLGSIEIGKKIAEYIINR